MFMRIMMMTLVGGLIGYATNVIAVKMLFRPLKPFKIPILGFEIQGLVPKRQNEIAISIGQTVAEELVSVEELMDQLVASSDKTIFIEMAKSKIIQMAEENMPPMIPVMFKGVITKYIEDAIDKDGESVMNELTEKLIHQATTKLDIAQMVAEKIRAFDLATLEALILSISKKELQHIEVLGGVLGILIGLIQAIIVTLFMS